VNSRLLNCVLAFALLVANCGCRRDMFRQPSSKPLARSDFFANEMASRPLLTNTVARGHLDDASPFFTGLNGTNPVPAFPLPVTIELLKQGRQQFETYCAVCHDRTGEGQGMIVQRGFPAPPSYHIDRLRDAPPGHFVDVIRNGYGIMYSYGDRVDATNRWAIAAYIRALQTSRHITLAQVPGNERAKLEGQP
jgi:mono/diheme cytochrome c family protein